MGPFEGGHHYLHYLHHNLAPGQTTRREHSPAQKKGGVTPQEMDPDLPVSVQESPAEARVGGGLLQGWGH